MAVSFSSKSVSTVGLNSLRVDLDFLGKLRSASRLIAGKGVLAQKSLVKVGLNWTVLTTLILTTLVTTITTFTVLEGSTGKST